MAHRFNHSSISLANTSTTILCIKKRFTQSCKNRNDSSNNIIHGPQWLSQQSADHYAVQVASVTDKNDLYDIAERYNHYLKDELSYFTVKSGRTEKYILVSGGYSSETEAASVIRRLPRYVNFQRPVMTRMGDIQKQL